MILPWAKFQESNFSCIRSRLRTGLGRLYLGLRTTTSAASISVWPAGSCCPCRWTSCTLRFWGFQRTNCCSCLLLCTTPGSTRICPRSLCQSRTTCPESTNLWTRSTSSVSTRCFEALPQSSYHGLSFPRENSLL